MHEDGGAGWVALCVWILGSVACETPMPMPMPMPMPEPAPNLSLLYRSASLSRSSRSSLRLSSRRSPRRSISTPRSSLSRRRSLDRLLAKPRPSSSSRGPLPLERKSASTLPRPRSKVPRAVDMPALPPGESEMPEPADEGPSREVRLPRMTSSSRRWSLASRGSRWKGDGDRRLTGDGRRSRTSRSRSWSRPLHPDRCSRSRKSRSRSKSGSRRSPPPPPLVKPRPPDGAGEKCPATDVGPRVDSISALGPRGGSRAVLLPIRPVPIESCRAFRLGMEGRRSGKRPGGVRSREDGGYRPSPWYRPPILLPDLKFGPAV